jgi:hypothetical protein
MTRSVEQAVRSRLLRILIVASAAAAAAGWMRRRVNMQALGDLLGILQALAVATAVGAACVVVVFWFQREKP